MHLTAGIRVKDGELWAEECLRSLRGFLDDIVILDDGSTDRAVRADMGTRTYYSYNAANQLLTETTGEDTIYYEYDGCGNTVARQEAAGTTYSVYDTENLGSTQACSARIDFPDQSHPPSLKLWRTGCHYTYDADSKRVSQRTADGYTRFIYQGPDMGRALQPAELFMERDEDGETKVQYTMAPLRPAAACGCRSVGQAGGPALHEQRLRARPAMHP